MQNCEIAFFGGSFTAIDRDYMISLLNVADWAVKKYGFIGIRCSTRPDKIDSEVLSILKAFSVTSIELGAQSMDDRVLFMNDRGHSSKDVRDASALIKSFGFELGLQMMTGLYGSDKETDLLTGREIIDIHPQTVRIYPTVTLDNTRLADLFRSGEYIPPNLDDTVSLCSELIVGFKQAGVDVIRVGLHATDEITEKRIAGPYHPAFGELCTSRILLNEFISELSQMDISGNYSIHVAPKLLSAAIGQKKSNLTELFKLGYSVSFLPDNSEDRFTIIETSRK